MPLVGRGLADPTEQGEWLSGDKRSRYGRSL